jgi:hypothetical protein
MHKFFRIISTRQTPHASLSRPIWFVANALRLLVDPPLLELEYIVVPAHDTTMQMILAVQARKKFELSIALLIPSKSFTTTEGEHHHGHDRNRHGYKG